MTQHLQRLCGNCGAFRGGNRKQGSHCRARPPYPIFLGMQQSGINLPDRPASATPIVMGYYPPVDLGDEACLDKWRPVETANDAENPDSNA